MKVKGINNPNIYLLLQAAVVRYKDLAEDQSSPLPNAECHTLHGHPAAVENVNTIKRIYEGMCGNPCPFQDWVVSDAYMSYRKSGDKADFEATIQGEPVLFS